MRTALIDADGARLEELDIQRWEAQWRLMPLDEAGLSAEDRRAAEALICEIAGEQGGLIAVADELRRRIGESLGTVNHGRQAMDGYRVRAADESLYVDRSS